MLKVKYSPPDAYHEHPAQFDLHEVDVRCGIVWDQKAGQYRDRMKVILCLCLNDQIVRGEKEARGTVAENTTPEQESEGPYDLLRRLLEELIIQQWPEIRDFLKNQVLMTGITMHEARNEELHFTHIAATWQFVVGIGTKRTLQFSTCCESQNSIRAMAVALLGSYKLIVYRWLLQEEGKQKAKSAAGKRKRLKRI